MARKKRKKSQASLPQRKGEVWEIGRRTLDVYVADLADQGEYPEMVLIVQAGESGGVVRSGALSSSDPPTALVDLLQQAMREPLFGQPRRPEMVRVSTQAEAETLSAILATSGIALEVTPELATFDTVLAEATQMLQGVTGDYRAQAAQAGTRLSESGLQELFRVAGQFYQEALWDGFDDETIFRIELQSAHGPSKTLYGIIMGNMGQEFGLALYTSLDDIQRIYEFGEENRDQLDTSFDDEELSDAEWQDTTELAAQFLSIPAVGLTFTSQQDVPPPLRQEATQLNLPLVDTSAYPFVMRTGGGRMQVASASDLGDMLAALRAILAWDKQIDELDVEDEIDVTITLQLPAVADFLPALTAHTTLIDNPFLVVDDIDDDLLSIDLGDILDTLLPELSDLETPQSVKKSSAAASKNNGKKAKGETPSQYTDEDEDEEEED